MLQNSLFRLFFMWFGALVWHVYRIVTFRPAYKLLADSRIVLYTFIALYYISGLARWTIVNPEVQDDQFMGAVVKISFGLAIHAIFLAFVAKPRKQNASLYSTMLGVSAAIDLFICVSYQLGLVDSIKGIQWIIIENVLYFVCYMQFRAEPKEVRSSGYRVGAQG